MAISVAITIFIAARITETANAHQGEFKQICTTIRFNAMKYDDC